MVSKTIDKSNKLHSMELLFEAFLLLFFKMMAEGCAFRHPYFQSSRAVALFLTRKSISKVSLLISFSIICNTTHLSIGCFLRCANNVQFVHRTLLFAVKHVFFSTLFVHLHMIKHRQSLSLQLEKNKKMSSNS